jgi:hypothetical protein
VTSDNESADVVVNSPTKRQATNRETYEYLVYYILGALEILLAFRLILKIAGASTGSAFVRLIYGVSRFFVMPFEGIFRRFSSQGLETTSVLEPSTLVAIIVYAILAVGIVKLIRISSGEEQIGGE